MEMIEELPQNLALVLKVLGEFARDGKRCPSDNREMRKQGGVATATAAFRARVRELGASRIPPKPVLRLVKLGFVEIEVYAHNWRVAKITKGPDVGLRTQACPIGNGKIAMRIDAAGIHKTPPS